MKKIFLLFIQIVVFNSLLAQQTQRTCGSTAYLAQEIAKDPTLVQKMQAIEQHTQNYVNGNSKKTRILVTIPVVFHVVYNTAAQNISDAQCIAQLNQLNLDFARLNTDAANTPAAFASLCAQTDVQFCLAQRDPQGNPTTGVLHVPTSTTSFSTNNGIKSSATGGSNPWPTGDYMNFWVGNLSGGLLGYAQFPGGGAATDGIVCGTNTVGSMLSPGAGGGPYNLGRTATHEVGHWLNLRHIWGDDGGACTGSDQVNDTPNSEDANYGCPNYPLLDACATANPGAMFMNYMDYTDDNCMNAFTIGQGARMQALFSAGGSRVSLLNSQGCLPIIINPCSGTPIAGTVNSTKDTLCGGETALLACVGYSTGVSGITFQWQTSPDNINWSNITGATTATYTAPSGSGVTWYRCQVTCTNTNQSAFSTSKPIYNYAVGSVSGDTICAPGVTSLFASGSGQINWYTPSNLTTPVFVGNPYNVFVSANALYYVSSGSISKYEVGPPDNTFSTSTSNATYTNGETFRAYTNLSVDTVFVYPTGTGNVIVRFVDSATNTIISSATVTITTAMVNTKVPVVCNFACNANTTYHLVATGSTVPGLMRNNNGTQYPYSVPNIISILRARATQTTRYYFFYDWKISATCTSGLTPVNVAVGTLSTSAVSSGSSCNGSATGIITASATTGTAPYTYNVNGGASSSSNIFNGLAPGTYTVQTTDATGCSGTALATVISGSNITAVANASNVLCADGVTGTINPIANGGTPTYTYTVNGLPLATGYSAGNYVVVATDASGCTASTFVSITQPTPLSVSANGANLPCAGNGASFNPVSMGGVPSYSYSVNGIPLTSNYPAGSYTIQSTDANGCTATTNISIVEPPLLVLLATTTPTGVSPCSGTLTAIATGGVGSYLFNINNGANQASNLFTGLCPGTYTVGVIDGNGCVRNYVATLGESPLDINNLTANGLVNIYPNPTKGLVQVLVENEVALGNLSIGVYNTIGQQVFEQKVLDAGKKIDVDLNLTALSVGLYNIVITDSKNKKYIKKLLMEK